MSVNCGVSLNPGFQFQILSPKLQDKIMNWKAWVEDIVVYLLLSLLPLSLKCIHCCTVTSSN